MGLAERRAVEEFKDKQFPALKQEIDQAAGFDVPLEVQWDTLAAEGYSHLYADAFPKVYFVPLRDAVKAIAVDQMGKDALKGGLKKVLVANTKEGFSCSSFSFEGGTLTIDHQPCSNIDDVGERTTGIQKMLEEKL
ncbi:MAG: hypothetical protein HYZ75_04270 [Elusimicrobia bacterium]|nr:hypothetical protein [Elusimicrobiota bacterium]